MLLTEDKRARLADAIARRQGAFGGADASAPSAHIVVVLLPLPRPRLIQPPLRRIKRWWRLTRRTRTLGERRLRESDGSHDDDLALRHQ